MTEAQINEYKAIASLGLMPDEENPVFLFASTHKDLLVQIAAGELDPIKVAKQELKWRGLNDHGKFVGFR